MKEKKRQKTQQQLGIAPSFRSSGTAISLEMLTQWTGSSSIRQFWGLDTGRSSLEGLVSPTSTVSSSLPSPGAETDHTIVWRATAAENPELTSTESTTLPSTPAAMGGRERALSASSEIIAGIAAMDIVGGTVETGVALNATRTGTRDATTSGTSEDASHDAAGDNRRTVALNKISPAFPQQSPFKKLSMTPADISSLISSSSSSLHRTHSDPAKAVAGVDGAHVAAAILRGDADSSVLLDSPEAAALVARVKDNLKKPLSDQLVEDLIRLARHKILVPSAKGKSRARLPTDVLASRHTRVVSASRLNTKLDPGAGEGGGARRPSSSLDMPFPLAITAIQEEHHDGELEPSPSTPPLLAVMQVHQFNAVAAPRASLIDDAGIKRQKGEDTVVFLGLIDWLQPYNARKRVEHGFKSILQDGKGISVQEPKAYASRFLRFISSVFAVEGDDHQS